MSELLNKMWKALLKETKKENLKPGDHIYTRTGANTEDHGIYLNSGCVIHFTQGRRGATSDDRHSICPNCSDHGAVTSCIDCFLSGRDHLYLFEYGVNAACILTKLAGGATLAPADPSPLVNNRASSFLVINSNDSSSYYRFINNGKDFAIYCKTGLLVIDNINFSRSRQAATFFFAVTVTFFLFLQQTTAATFTGAAATCFCLYCIYRFGSDIGARPNVIKVDQVETLPHAAEELSSAASGFRPIQSLIDLFIVLLMTLFNIPLLLTARTWSEPRQLLSETPGVVWILACIVLFYLAILQKRLLSNKIHKKQLKPGDHIYAWRGFSRRAHAHHGIYVGDIHGSRQKEVIHLVRAGDPILPSSSATSNQAERTQGDPILPSSSATSNQAERTHVNYCSLEDFLKGDELCLHKYGVSLAFFIAKTWGGTCALGAADPPRMVLYRARRACQRLQGYDAYNLINNNCEDFAIHCKTGLPLRTGSIQCGRSGQIAFFFGLVCAGIIFLLKFKIRAAAAFYYIFSMFRFLADATHCLRAYQVELQMVQPWRRHGRRFWPDPQFKSLEGKKLLF
ncbi:uncharacterized protein LOC132803622 [Ziziphus jujuba]|uniref:Uncharacterized protein LOC132803622 n=1 Tax=Ziziphus jujuba TaxID=326968 RepID=A0ABM4A816_ZIZJJ|nr:uncharacterized protein LOC132803622 [Ziziphus jujuba]